MRVKLNIWKDFKAKVDKEKKERIWRQNIRKEIIIKKELQTKP